MHLFCFCVAYLVVAFLLGSGVGKWMKKRNGDA